METVAVSTRNRTNKGNKENAQPAPGGKPLIRSKKPPVAPLQLKNNEKEAMPAPLGAKPKKLETKSTNAASVVARRQTHSRAFLTEQVARHQKIMAEAPKQPAVVQAPRSAPGMYKGKVVQSKVGAIWRSTASLDKAGADLSALKTGGQRVDNVKSQRSKSVSDLPVTKKTAPAVRNRPGQAPKPAATGRPAAFLSARPPTRTITATKTSTSSRNLKGSETTSSKPKTQIRENKVNKPPVTSTISQYRLNTETTEERRARLAEWLASKGKTLKRPVLTTAAPQKIKAPKPIANHKPESHVEPQPAAQSEPETQQSVKAQEPEPTAANCADTQEVVLTTCDQTPTIMSTTAALLEDSDVDLSGDLQDSIDDIVVNLCVALEEMAIPSMSGEEMPQGSDERKDLTENDEGKDECKKEVKSESDDEKVETEEDDDEEEEEDDDEGKENDDASVVKYNVKTTPYLQNMRKTIEGEITSSRRKSNIKDLKFLTPVRRSTRIQRKSSHLPAMLMDHDSCVSSLAELINNGEDPNLYICRSNPALLDSLPGL